MIFQELSRGYTENIGNFEVQVNRIDITTECHGLPIIELNGNIVGNAKSPKIERVIFNDPATVVFWSDGTKTVVKCQEGDSYNEQTGLLMCIAKKHFGNNGSFNDVLHKWVPREEVEQDKPVDISGLIAEMFTKIWKKEDEKEQRFDWEAFKAGKIAVILEKEETEDDFLRKCGKQGVRWGCGDLANNWKPTMFCGKKYSVHCLGDRMFYSGEIDSPRDMFGCDVIEWKTTTE